MVYKYLFILLFVINAYAQFDLKDIKTFEASFIQSIYNESNKELKYEGKLYISDVGKVLWQYKTPILKNVYLLNNNVIIDEPELEQAIYTKLNQGIDFIKLLKNAKRIDANTYIAKIQNVTYKILIKNEKIDQIVYKDQLDNNITIKFVEAMQNIPLDHSIFNFLPPDYYDIIEK